MAYFDKKMKFWSSFHGNWSVNRQFGMFILDSLIRSTFWKMFGKMLTENGS